MMPISPTKRGALTKYGYSANKEIGIRRAALVSAGNKLGISKVLKMLNGLKILNKKNQKLVAIFTSDYTYIKSRQKASSPKVSPKKKSPRKRSPRKKSPRKKLSGGATGASGFPGLSGLPGGPKGKSSCGCES